MQSDMKGRRGSVALLAVALLGGLRHIWKVGDGADPKAPAFDFGRDGRPILAKNCTRCHGPGKQEGVLLLDSRDSALEGGDSGSPLKSARVEDNLLLGRITSEDPAFRMP